MSNPAVITIASLNGRNNTFKRFQVEDNIGEAIHLHIDNMRIDFTINEFLEFSQMIKDSLYGLDLLNGYDIDNFDEHFLYECSCFLPNLIEIKIEDIQLSQLKCIVHSNYRSDLNLYNIVSVKNTPAYQYLKGNKEKFVHYRQHNYFSVNNEKRLLDTLESVKINQYPHKNKFIILFDGQNYIRDGQHRAAILSHLNGLDSHIKIMRFYFKGKSHIFKKNTNNFKSFVIWILKKIRSKLTGFSIN